MISKISQSNREDKEGKKQEVEGAYGIFVNIHNYLSLLNISRDRIGIRETNKKIRAQKLRKFSLSRFCNCRVHTCTDLKGVPP